jgi:diguanylate cyclase (GGDEF)-like protein
LPALTSAIVALLGALVSQSDLAVIKTTMLIGGALTIVLGGLSLRATRRERLARALVEHRLREREEADRGRAAAEAKLRYLVDHDPLTGLLNRRAYELILTDHLTRGERYGHEGAVMMLDLDEFKQVNDTLGHSAGDDLIVRVGNALAARLRESDTVARLGGDEFAILLPKGARPEAEQVATALLDTIRAERSARGREGRARPVSASIGVAPLAGLEGITAEQALINADLAMYDAKEAGRDRFETYDSSSTAKAGIQSRLEWVERIRTALDEDLFTLHAQPVVEAATGETTQLELLIRMTGPEDELVMPASFLPIAERFGLINEIDHWVVTQTIKLLGAQARRGVRPTVEINLSGHSLTDPNLADHIASELRNSNVDPTQLIFEVTETAAISNIEAAQHFAEQLAKLGCRFALDDFGAGFGSFYYLKHLPFDFIKIDGEFIHQLVTDPTDRLVVSAVVDLARGLGKRTIAEFVGDEATVATLRVLGVDYLQGYHLGKPAPVESWMPPAPSPAQFTAAL